MLREMFSKHETYEVCGTVLCERFVSFGSNFLVIDDFDYLYAEELNLYMDKIEDTIKTDFFIVLFAREKPDYNIIHMDYAFNLETIADLDRAQEFFQSTLAYET